MRKKNKQLNNNEEDRLQFQMEGTSRSLISFYFEVQWKWALFLHKEGNGHSAQMLSRISQKEITFIV